MKITYKVWAQSSKTGEWSEIETTTNTALVGEWSSNMRFLKPTVCYEPLGQCSCDSNEKDVLRIQLK